MGYSIERELSIVMRPVEGEEVIEVDVRHGGMSKVVKESTVVNEIGQGGGMIGVEIGANAVVIPSRTRGGITTLWKQWIGKLNEGHTEERKPEAVRVDEGVTLSR